ncbi:ubiquitin-like domain-containing protein [Streptomyces sp. NPDC008313]|uniref:ubiquitin-like domain-containing protein n=1 Tax=Streptomyces sp. NPDC008313 TaxID=3364826 RepID=UPI0036ECB1ED
MRNPQDQQDQQQDQRDRRSPSPSAYAAYAYGPHGTLVAQETGAAADPHGRPPDGAPARAGLPGGFRAYTRAAVHPDRGTPAAPAAPPAPGTHDAPTLPYGVRQGPGRQAYADTYRPAYEQRPRPRPRPRTRPEDQGREQPSPLPSPSPGPRPVPEAVVPRPAPRAAGARRAAAHRRAAPVRADPLRKLLPQALVVVFLAGGTTAFVAKDKAVELSVDGRPRTLHTFADDVTGLLAEEGVAVGAHDHVVPAPGTRLTSGDEISVRHGRPLVLTLDGRGAEVWTTARTVEGALAGLGVRAEGAYVSVPRSRRIGRAGMTLDVRTERTVTVMADGRARTVRTNAATVREAVGEAGVTLRGDDTTSVRPGSFPRDGQTVTVLRITGNREVREEPVPFDVRRTDDPELFEGTEVVERPGRPGARRVTYFLRSVNGVRQRPRRLGAEVVREPRTQIVRVGTRPRPTSVADVGRLDWDGLAQCESGGDPALVDPSGTYGGLYQFDTGTWHDLGGRGRPEKAPAAEQTYRAKKLYVRRGASPWPHCGDRLHG